MTWRCSKCNTEHETPEKRAGCKRVVMRERIVVIAILVALVGVIGLVDVAWNVYAYGDWKCAFMECRKVVK